MVMIMDENINKEIGNKNDIHNIIRCQSNLKNGELIIREFEGWEIDV